MEWKYVNKPVALARDDKGNVTESITIIQCDNPYTVLTGKLKGDWINRDKADVVDAVLEYNHKLLFVNRAMAESVLKVEEMDNKIKEVDLVIASLKETEKRITEEAQVTQNTLMDVLDQMVEKGLIEV